MDLGWTPPPLLENVQKETDSSRDYFPNAKKFKFWGRGGECGGPLTYDNYRMGGGNVNIQSTLAEWAVYKEEALHAMHGLTDHLLHSYWSDPSIPFHWADSVQID